VILLAEGHAIYNGPPSGVRDYFSQFGYEMGRYVNAADKLLQIASQPSRILDPATTIEKLAK